MNKIEDIANGYKNLFRSKVGLTSEQEEELFKARREVCSACQPDNKVVCKACGCPLAAKIRCKDCKCPKQHW